MDPIAQLLELIRRHSRVTVKLAEFLDYYDRCFPEWRHDPAREIRCRHVLKQLSQAPFCAIVLPSEGTIQARNRNYQGSLPRFIRKVSAKPPSAVNRVEDNWLPDLADLAATLRGDRLTDLRRINEFLKQYPGPLPQVPYRERSLQIFGDEKAMDERLTVKGDTLFGGRLPLARLGAFNPPLPFPFTQPDPPAQEPPSWWSRTTIPLPAWSWRTTGIGCSLPSPGAAAMRSPRDAPSTWTPFWIVPGQAE